MALSTQQIRQLQSRLIATLESDPHNGGVVKFSGAELRHLVDRLGSELKWRAWLVPDEP